MGAQCGPACLPSCRGPIGTSWGVRRQPEVTVTADLISGKPARLLRAAEALSRLS